MLLFILSIFLGAIGAYLIKSYGSKIGLVDSPNHRSSHSIPTPKGGGIGILAAFIAASLITKQPPTFYLPITSISLLGLFGDHHELSAKLRLILQFILTIIIVINLTSWNLITPSLLFLLSIWVLFIVGTANFYNFMDGINGIAGVTGIIAFGLLAAYIPETTANKSYVLLAASLGCACVGFLPFNFPHAKTFMGDVGSILLGYVYGILVFLISSTFLDFICYASFLFPFYIDELSTMFIRIKSRENLAQAHRKHLYQILVNEYAQDHWKITVAYGLLQLIVGVGVISLRTYGSVAVLTFLLFFSFSFIAISNYFRKHI